MRFIIAVTLSLTVFCLQMAAQTFSQALNISNSSDPSKSARIAVENGGRVYVAWLESSSVGFNVFFAKSCDCGASFSDPVNISESGGVPQDLFFPVLLDAKGEAVYIAWVDRSSGQGEILFSRSLDAGETFSTPKVISGTATNSLFSNTNQMTIAADGSINLVWDEDLPGHRDILFSSSTDQGATFFESKNLSQDPSGLRFDLGGVVAINNDGGIHAAWESQANFANLNGGFHTRSTDGGTTFDPLTQFPDTSFGPLFHDGEVLFGPANEIFLVAGPTGPEPHVAEIFLLRSNDGGQSFSEPLNLSDNSGISQGGHHVLDADGNLFVVWLDDTAGNFEIFLRRSDDGGLTFAPTVNVSQNIGQSHGSTAVLSSGPELFVAGAGNVSIVWFDSTPGNFDVFFAWSSDGGANFVVQNISTSLGSKSFLDAAMDSSERICIAWDDNSPGNSEILIRCGASDSLQRVVIDIKPNSFPNSINLGSSGNVPVAIFSTSCFDATSIDPATVTLASAPVRLRGQGISMSFFEDVNEDGLLDIVVHIDTEALEISDSDRIAILRGFTFNGEPIEGSDTVRIVP